MILTRVARSRQIGRARIKERSWRVLVAEFAEQATDRRHDRHRQGAVVRRFARRQLKWGPCQHSNQRPAPDPWHPAVRGKELFWSPLSNRYDGAPGLPPHSSRAGLAHHRPEPGVSGQRPFGVDHHALPSTHRVNGGRKGRTGVFALSLDGDLTCCVQQAAEHRNIKELGLPQKARTTASVIDEVSDRQRVRVRDVVGDHNAATTGRDVLLAVPFAPAHRPQGRAQNCARHRVGRTGAATASTDTPLQDSPRPNCSSLVLPPCGVEDCGLRGCGLRGLPAAGCTGRGDRTLRRMWHAVVPLKGWGTSKSRLALPDAVRRQIVQAMAARHARRTQRMPGSADHLGTRARPGTGPGRRYCAVSAAVVVQPDAAASLNAALRWFAGSRVDRQQPLAVVVADLPALQGRSLSAVLLQAQRHSFAMVADREGSGTTVLTALRRHRPGPTLRNANSAAAHRAAGAATLVASPPDLACDVDTLADLAHARTLGLGRCTSALVADPATAPG